MRLTPEQLSAIRMAVAETFGDAAKIWLFGSRVDDNKRGGDIDLLIETRQSDVAAIVRAEMALLTKLQMQLGEQKIDVLVDYPTRHDTPPFTPLPNKQAFLYERRHALVATTGRLARM